MLAFLIMASTPFQHQFILYFSFVIVAVVMIYLAGWGRWEDRLSRLLILLCPLIYSIGLPIFSVISDNEYSGVFLAFSILYYSVGVMCLYFHLCINEKRRQKTD